MNNYTIKQEPLDFLLDSKPVLDNQDNRDATPRPNKKRCRNGGDCKTLQRIGSCRFVHPSCEIPCNVEVRYGECRRHVCHYKHTPYNRNVYYAEAAQRDNTDIRNIVKDMSNKRLICLLEAQIKCLNYGEKLVFMYNEKLYDDLFDLSDDILRKQ